MSFRWFFRAAIPRLYLSWFQRPSRKWLARIGIVLIAAFFTANVSLASPADFRLRATSKNLKASEPNEQPNNPKSRIDNADEHGWKQIGGLRSSACIGACQIPDAQLLQQGRELFQAEKFAAAQTVWQQAVVAFQAQRDTLNEALALSYLSLAYQQQGKWQQATAAIASSLSLLRAKENSSTSRERLSILAQALGTQGHLQLALGQTEQALTTWQQAAATYAQTDDQEGIIGNQINQSQALQSLGLYRRARHTLEIVEATLQNRPNSLIKAIVLRSLGNALRVIGDLDKSRELLQQSLSIAQQLQSLSAISAAQFSLGNTVRALAKRAANLDDTSTTKIEFQLALNAYQQAAATSTSPMMQVQAQLNQLSLLVDIQQFNEAAVLWSPIQLHLHELPASRSSIYASINLAESLTRWKQAALGNREEYNQLPIPNSQSLTPTWSDIAQILARAVEEARSLKDQRAESYAFGNLGGLYELTRQTQEALNLTQQALVIAQAINASDIAYRWQWQLGRLLKTQGNTEGAIAAYQVAVKTLNSLRSDLVAINSDNPDVQFSFRESVEPVYRELVGLLLQADHRVRDKEDKGTLAPQRDSAAQGDKGDKVMLSPSPQLFNLQSPVSQENLRQARQVIESLQLAELDNFFQETCLDAKPVQIDQVDSQAAVIYPIILPDRLEVILALPHSPLRHYSTSQPQRVVESLLDSLQQDIGRLAANNQQVLHQSQQVYDWLIRPAEAELQQHTIQTLVFVLDGLLRNVPMAALHDGQQYLIEKYSIALTPGLQMLVSQPLAQKAIRALTVGLSKARQGFSSLPNVVQELEQIQSQVPGRLLLNQEFTDNNLQKELNSSTFSVVHIATHGQFSSQADKTFILTWDGKINVKELNSLLRRRGEEASRPIELLVFSACETADGDKRAALGLAGVAVRAGARSTLGTLWTVSDQSTSVLMVRFYHELTHPGVTKAEALRRAQLSLLLEPKYRTPYFWAPYVLVGNWR